MNDSPLRRPGRPKAVSEAAAVWALRQEEAALSEAEERRFVAWLGEDPSHGPAYEDAIWALDAVSRHAGEPDIMALRGAALTAGGKRDSYWGWTAALGLAAASIAVVVLSTATPPAIPTESPRIGKATRVAEEVLDPARSVYRTSIGQRSAIELPDGSVATLDTDSQIRVAYGPTERGVYLLKGQALFQVAHGKRSPFKVYAGSQRITAVGTIFNVRLEGAEVQVAMVEGSVKVRPAVAAARDLALPVKEMTLTAGEALTADLASPLLVRNVDVAQVVSWKGGVLMFNDTRLSDAVAEINRYTQRPIAIADSAVGNYRISGVFKSNDPEHFSRAVAEVLPVEVTHAPDGAPILRAQSITPK